MTHHSIFMSVCEVLCGVCGAKLFSFSSVVSLSLSFCTLPTSQCEFQLCYSGGSESEVPEAKCATTVRLLSVQLEPHTGSGGIPALLVGLTILPGDRKTKMLQVYTVQYL